MRNMLHIAVVVLALGGSPALADDPPREWDGLTRVESTRFDAVYLAPGADFSGYTKVMLDPTEVAFRRNWVRDYNNTTRDLGARISDREAQEMLDRVRTGFQDVFAEEYRRAGYELVTTPGPDVLRLRTAVTNIEIAAPDQMTSARSRTYSEDAGEATLVIEARDSMSGAILGRAVDRRTADDNSFMVRRNSATNTWDFERMVRAWGEKSASALSGMRATPAPAAPPATGQR